MENKNTENISLESKLYTAKEVAIILGVSRSTEYREIKCLNAELEAQGYITITGKIYKRFFNGRAYF